MKYNYDNVVIGSSFEAVLYAFMHNYPILYTEYDFPFRFDYLDFNVDLSAISLQNTPTSIKTPTENLVVGVPKTLLWERMLFLLSLDSKAILSNLCSSIRRVNNKIICSNEYSKIATVTFNNCHYFHNVSFQVFGLDLHKNIFRYL